ncbi:MAG: hypothetical protein HQL97_13990 [Magnetococcales bacterium]|nr:hypothetical protein [Magnetococcales bacterium]
MDEFLKVTSTSPASSWATIMRDDGEVIDLAILRAQNKDQRFSNASTRTAKASN